MGNRASRITKRNQKDSLVSSELLSDSSHTQKLPELVFGEAEQLLLDEARARFDFEQKTAGALHSKSALFLTLTSVFAAFITASIGRLLDRVPNFFLERATLGVFLLSLGFLTVAAILLGRSALSRSYQVIATPSHWVEHLAILRQVSKRTPNQEQEIFARLRQDILNAWVQAAEVCFIVNEAKASVLERVSKLLSIAAFLAFLGILLLVLQKTIR